MQKKLISAQPRISPQPLPHPSPTPTQTEIGAHLALLHLRVLLFPFTVLLQNIHVTFLENGENLISAQPRISAHSQGPKFYKRPGRLIE